MKEIEIFRDKVEKIIFNKTNIVNMLAEINKVHLAIQILTNKRINLKQISYRPTFERKYT